MTDYVSIVRNVDIFTKSYKSNISESQKSAFLKYRHMVHRNRKVYEKFAKQQNSPIEDMLSEQGRDDIKRVEGILIESFRRKYGHFPLWNSMGGSMVGQTKVMENNINIVNSFCQPDNYAINPIVSRSTIRELSRNPEWEWYENYLHAARMNACK